MFSGHVSRLWLLASSCSCTADIKLLVDVFVGFRVVFFCFPAVLSLQFSSDSVAQHKLYVKEHKVRAEKSSHRPLDRTLFLLNIPPYCSEVRLCCNERELWLVCFPHLSSHRSLLFIPAVCVSGCCQRVVLAVWMCSVSGAERPSGFTAVWTQTVQVL